MFYAKQNWNEYRKKHGDFTIRDVFLKWNISKNAYEILMILRIITSLKTSICLYWKIFLIQLFPRKPN